jgi:hypothetical protein
MRKNEAIMYANGILNGDEANAKVIVSQVKELHGEDAVNELLVELHRVLSGVVL